jgi:hypothetical protein
MAKNRPVKICVIKHNPNNDPKFHQLEIFEGAGRSIKALFIILNKGCIFRIGLFINLIARLKIFGAYGALKNISSFYSGN